MAAPQCLSSHIHTARSDDAKTEKGSPASLEEKVDSIEVTKM